MMNYSIDTQKSSIQEDSWTSLKNITKARIALGNVGGSLPLREVLNFKLAHALAKDAIYSGLNIDDIQQRLLDAFDIPVFSIHSRVENRQQYLRRPDLGRRLDKESVAKLTKMKQTFDMIFVVTDGLSAEAVNTHASEVLQMVIPLVISQFSTAVVLVEQGRVAIGDEIGELLDARFTSVFIGERPGLSSPESMGIYTTYHPRIGLTDERRNCISNIHQDGLNYIEASSILFYLIKQSFLNKTSGIDIKVAFDKLTLAETSSIENNL